MTPEQIKAIRERAEKATESPWVASHEGSTTAEVATVAWVNSVRRFTVADWFVGVPTPNAPGGDYRNVTFGHDADDAQFIAHARTDVPALCDALEEALAKLGALEGDSK